MRQVLGVRLREPGLGDFLSEGAQVALPEKVAFSTVYSL